MFQPTRILLTPDTLAAFAEAGEAADQVALESAYIRIANLVLGLVGITAGGDSATTLEDAIALQVNFQVEAFPLALIKSEGAGPVTSTYRDDVVAHPVAARMVALILAALAPALEMQGEYKTLRGLRNAYR